MSSAIPCSSINAVLPSSSCLPSTPLPDLRCLDAQAALQRLRAAFERFAAYSGELQPHFAYGALTHAEYAEAHVMHLYNHLSLIRQA